MQEAPCGRSGSAARGLRIRKSGAAPVSPCRHRDRIVTLTPRFRLGTAVAQERQPPITRRVLRDDPHRPSVIRAGDLSAGPLRTPRRASLIPRPRWPHTVAATLTAMTAKNAKASRIHRRFPRGGPGGDRVVARILVDRAPPRTRPGAPVGGWPPGGRTGPLTADFLATTAHRTSPLRTHRPPTRRQGRDSYLV